MTPISHAAHERRKAASKAAKQRRKGVCVDCGAQTAYSGQPGEKHPNGSSLRCVKCAPRAACGIWTRERITDAIRDFADQYGRPPVAHDWNPSDAKRSGYPDKAERFHRDGCWPHVVTVQRYFGSWNAAIEAAGFAPTPVGWYRSHSPKIRRQGAVMENA